MTLRRRCGVLDLLCYIAGLISGVGITLLGLWIGFKLSYDIRSVNGGEDMPVNPLRGGKEIAEFDLMEKKAEEI